MKENISAIDRYATACERTIKSLSELESEIEKDFNSYSLKKTLTTEGLKYLGVLFGFVVAATGLILISIKPLEIFADKKYTFEEYGVIATIVVLLLLVFSIFYWFFIRNISNSLAKNSISFNKVVKKSIEDYRLLQYQNLYNYELSENIRKAPVSNLLSWNNSEDIEFRSLNVWSISYTLKWLTPDRIKDIIDELITKPNNEYRYIYIGEEPDKVIPEIFKEAYICIKFALRNIIDLEHKKNTELEKSINKIRSKKQKATRLLQLELIKCREKERNEKLPECIMQRFQIKSLNEKIPIPNDVCIYSKFQNGKIHDQEIVVINTREFKDCDKEKDKENNFDLKFFNDEQILRVKTWFEEKWESIPQIQKAS